MGVFFLKYLENNLENFALWFTKRRIECGFKSQRQLALKAEVDTSVISRIESGNKKRIEIEVLEKISPYFDLTIDEIIEISETLTEKAYEPTETKPINKDIRIFFQRENVEFDNMLITDVEKSLVIKILETTKQLKDK